MLIHQIENQSYEKTWLGQTNFDKALTPDASIEDLQSAQKGLLEAKDLDELKVALEVADLKSQIATSSGSPNRSQFVTTSTHGGRRTGTALGIHMS